MDQDLVSYLGTKGVQVRKANGAEIVVHCFFCNEEKRQPKLYLNAESWLYDCKLCGETGNKKTLLRHFGDKDDDEVAYLPGRDPAARRRVLKTAAARAHNLLLANDTMLAYLLERGLDPETIVENQIGYVPPNLGFARSLDDDFTIADLINAGLLTPGGSEFLNNSLTIPYFHHGSVVQLRAKDMEGSYRTAGGDDVRLYNEDALQGADRALICEGEFDALITQQVLAASGDPVARSLAVVAIPGASALPDNMPTMFSTMKRVYIGLDPDAPGQKGTARLKEAFKSQSRVAELPRGGDVKCDWSEFLREKDAAHPWGGHGWRDVLSILAEADLVGKRVFTIAEAQYKWEQDKVERPGIKLGFPSLDSRIKPGLRPGQLMIPLAKTGCIAGGAEVVVNRAGKSFRITMEQLVDRFHGGGKMGPRWRTDIPTFIQREVEGVVRLGRITNAWHSGIKTTYEIKTVGGRTVRATDEHPFLTSQGWRRLDELVAGDELHVNSGRSVAGRAKKPSYRYRSSLHEHPFAGRKNIMGTGGTSVPLHRLVAEADLNKMDLAVYLDRLRTPGGASGLVFLDPAQWAVHHKDHDEKNNDLPNLMVLTHEEHARLHADEGTSKNVLEQVGLDVIVSIIRYGEEATYDIEVEDDPHNFIVNEFVVHNTGKTVFLANVANNTRQYRTLFLSLELTAVELFGMLRRIHFFHNPEAPMSQMSDDYKWLRIVDENRVRQQDLETLVAEYTEDVGAAPELLIVDYLGYYARGFIGGSPYEKTSDAVMQLKAEAKHNDLAVIAPHQVSRKGKDGVPLEADDARDSGVVEETGDFVMSLFRPDQAIGSEDAITGAFNVQLLKSRHGGKGHSANLRFSNMSLVIVDALDRMASNRVDQENTLYQQGYDYEEYRKKQSSVQMQVVVS